MEAINFVRDLNQYQSDIEKNGVSEIQFNEIEVVGAEIRELVLSELVSVKSIFNHVQFNQSDLYGSCFIETVLKDCSFENVNFNKANLNRTVIRNCTFINCSFLGAEVMGAEITNTVFFDCSFRDIIFSNNDIRSSTFTITDREFSVINDNTEVDTNWIFPGIQ